MVLITPLIIGFQQTQNQFHSLKKYSHIYSLIFLLFTIMQIATLITFQKTFVSYALALFQLSSLISVFLGHHVLKEGNFLPRVAGSLIMIGGALLIITA
jgi:drug/metabolite transporter (DMT)-like permease